MPASSWPYLNSTLSELRFGGERFEFITQPAPSLRQIYDMIMDSQIDPRQLPL